MTFIRLVVMIMLCKTGVYFGIALQYGDMQGYFYARTRWNTVPEVLCQKEASRYSIPESFFPDIGVSNTFPSPTAFWVTVLSGTYVFRKNSTGDKY
jgi:hypothetical protein